MPILEMAGPDPLASRAEPMPQEEMFRALPGGSRV
jgi:hypothetical protein